MEEFKFKLRGLTWTVRLVTESEMKAVDPDLPMGYTFFEKLFCYVRNDIHPDQIKSTFFHELFHTIVAQLNGSKLDLLHDAIDIETTCNIFGDAMVELLPQMKKWPKIVMPNNSF
jgi:hypothetical protein